MSLLSNPQLRAQDMSGLHSFAGMSSPWSTLQSAGGSPPNQWSYQLPAGLNHMAGTSVGLLQQQQHQQVNMPASSCQLFMQNPYMFGNVHAMLQPQQQQQQNNTPYYMVPSQLLQVALSSPVNSSLIVPQVNLNNDANTLPTTKRSRLMPHLSDTDSDSDKDATPANKQMVELTELITESSARVKGPWTSKEDRRLKELVAEFGTRWSVIAERLPGRIGKQCRERWLNHLDDSIKRSPWMASEDSILLEAHKTKGNRWSEIAKLLPGRPENSVKNRYTSLAHKQAKSTSLAGSGTNTISDDDSISSAHSAADSPESTNSSGC